MSLSIIYQDEFLVAIAKPPGLLVHRSLIDKTETSFAVQKLRDQISKYVFPVHRLDKPTSGVLVFALDEDTARKLSLQFSENQVKKVYWALVRGHLISQEVDYSLKEILDKKSDFMAKKDKPPQSARTNLLCLEKFELPIQVDKFPTSRYSLVEAEPKTGRKHQIRRHLRHIGHPILGDITHGVGKHNRFIESQFGVRQLHLSCMSMEFTHPQTQSLLKICAPLSPGFNSVLTKLRTQYRI